MLSCMAGNARGRREMSMRMARPVTRKSFSGWQRRANVYGGRWARGVDGLLSMCVAMRMKIRREGMSAGDKRRGS